MTEAEYLRDLLSRVAATAWLDDYFAGKYNSDLPEEDRLRDEVRTALRLPPGPLQRQP